jgi:hypothetical protein
MHDPCPFRAAVHSSDLFCMNYIIGYVDDHNFHDAIISIG